MGAHFEALDEGVLVAPLDSRYTKVGFNLISVQVCAWFYSSSDFECLTYVVVLLCVFWSDESARSCL